jgi:hypothetical protein
MQRQRQRRAPASGIRSCPRPTENSRATIQAAADAYLDLFNNKSVVVPWGTPCDRLEGSWYTGDGSATDCCDVGDTIKDVTVEMGKESFNNGGRWQ